MRPTKADISKIPPQLCQLPQNGSWCRPLFHPINYYFRRFQKKCHILKYLISISNVRSLGIVSNVGLDAIRLFLGVSMSYIVYICIYIYIYKTIMTCTPLYMAYTLYTDIYTIYMTILTCTPLYMAYTLYTSTYTIYTLPTTLTCLSCIWHIHYIDVYTDIYNIGHAYT